MSTAIPHHLQGLAVYVPIYMRFKYLQLSFESEPSPFQGPCCAQASSARVISYVSELFSCVSNIVKTNGTESHKQPQCHPWTLVTVGQLPRPCPRF